VSEKTETTETTTTSSGTTEPTSTTEGNSTTSQTTSEQEGSTSTEPTLSNPIADAIKGKGDEDTTATTEGDEDPAVTTKGDEDPAATATEEPESYDITVADNSPLSDEDLDHIATLAGEKGWTKEQADEMVGIYEESYKRGMVAANSPRLKYYEDQKNFFDKDPAFNGENKDASFLAIKTVVDKFGDDEMVKQLSSPEIGNNYALAKLLKSIGESLMGDNPSSAGKGSSTPVSNDSEYTQSLKNLYPQYFDEKSA